MVEAEGSDEGDATGGVSPESDLLEALFWACRAGVEATVSSLLDDEPSLVTREIGAYEGHDVYGAVPIASNKRCYTFTGDEKDGYTYALHVAAESGHKQLVKKLVNTFGADRDSEDYRGRTASVVANAAAKEAFLELSGKQFAVVENYEGETDDQGQPHGKGILRHKEAGYEETPHASLTRARPTRRGDARPRPTMTRTRSFAGRLRPRS